MSTRFPGNEKPLHLHLTLSDGDKTVLIRDLTLGLSGTRFYDQSPQQVMDQITAEIDPDCPAKLDRKKLDSLLADIRHCGMALIEHKYGTFEGKPNLITDLKRTVEAVYVKSLGKLESFAIKADEFSVAINESGVSYSAVTPKSNDASIEVKIKEPSHKDDLDLLSDRIAALEAGLQSLQMATTSAQLDANRALAAK